MAMPPFLLALHRLSAAHTPHAFSGSVAERARLEAFSVESCQAPRTVRPRVCKCNI